MDRRRHRPEEMESWSRVATNLNKLNENYYQNPPSVDLVGRVNRLISAWPQDDTLPAEGYEGLRPVFKKLTPGLQEIKRHADQETSVIDQALRDLSVLIEQRKASESEPPEKKNKRPRVVSPGRGSTPGTPSLGSINKITIPKKEKEHIPFQKDPKLRREALQAQLPLQEGRKVAFHPPAPKSHDGVGAEVDENTWILAVITQCIKDDKNRYAVQDAEPQENGQPGATYHTTLRAIIPLPDPNAPPNSAAHLNAYRQFPANSTVMALYPDTSCFYRAEVIASPQGKQPVGKAMPTYKLRFEDDDDQEHTVAAQWVVEWPGQA